MSALHQIEASGGAARAQAAPHALDGVRRALQSLQADQSGHAAVIAATEAVAGSLGMVHGLTQGPPAAAPAPAAAQNMAFAGTMVAAPATQPSPALAGGHHQPAPAPHQAAPPIAPHSAPTEPARPAAGGGAARGAAPAQASGSLKVAAELGVHSATNFYKGLSGNDLFDSGGIFIATYQIPQIGRELTIHVSMPGGYEFEAKGIVRWTREAPLSSASGSESPPGFGAQFTEISQEGKQLIQRYVRNREPLFHDDL
ncbi:MAG TPA: PilZ domain-containing protein [Polyangiaceae bacterium]|nr:PilZ domain-containing protein [Polyangiaceae bacterium]